MEVLGYIICQWHNMDEAFWLDVAVPQNCNLDIKDGWDYAPDGFFGDAELPMSLQIQNAKVFYRRVRNEAEAKKWLKRIAELEG